VWNTAAVADYRELNRANWDDRVPAHVASADYAVQRFLDDPAFLSDVVRFDLPLLGDVAGLRGAHLQCHIGTDTVSLARLGASMTGLAEHATVPWRPFSGETMVSGGAGEWRLAEVPERLAASFTIQAVKNS
jgi:hypothetical protein